MPKLNMIQVAEEAKRYQTRTEFQKGSPRHYKKAWNAGKLDEVCGHMTDARKRWTRDAIIAAALPHQTRTEFQQAEPQAYAAARYHGILDEACRHM